MKPYILIRYIRDVLTKDNKLIFDKTKKKIVMTIDIEECHLFIIGKVTVTLREKKYNIFSMETEKHRIYFLIYFISTVVNN